MSIPYCKTHGLDFRIGCKNCRHASGATDVPRKPPAPTKPRESTCPIHGSTVQEGCEHCEIEAINDRIARYAIDELSDVPQGLFAEPITPHLSPRIQTREHSNALPGRLYYTPGPKRAIDDPLPPWVAEFEAQQARYQAIGQIMDATTFKWPDCDATCPSVILDAIAVLLRKGKP